LECFGVGLVACSPVSNQMPPNSEVSALTIKASDVVTRRQAAPHTDETRRILISPHQNNSQHYETTDQKSAEK